MEFDNLAGRIVRCVYEKCGGKNPHALDYIGNLGLRKNSFFEMRGYFDTTGLDPVQVLQAYISFESIAKRLYSQEWEYNRHDLRLLTYDDKEVMLIPACELFHVSQVRSIRPIDRSAIENEIMEHMQDMDSSPSK